MIDSVEKIVTRYFASVTKEPFTYKKKIFLPKPLRVSENIFLSRMTCVEKCGACCHRFSLDYLPMEVEKVTNLAARSGLSQRLIEFNGRSVVVFSDTQEDSQSHSCRHLNMETGRCGIHLSHPFSCDFELLRFHHFEDDTTPNQLAHRHFGRGWAMKRIDGERGALCEWYEKPCDQGQIDDMARKLTRLKDWTDHFGLVTHLPTIIEWVKRGPHKKALTVGQEIRGGLF